MKPTVNLIAAVGNQGQIGLNNQLPWPKNTNDLKWFKNLTIGNIVIVGYNTALTLPKLPDRELIVFNRNDTPEAFMDQHIQRYDDRQIWIAGGRKTYQLWLPYIDRFYISKIDYNGPADTYFPFEDMYRFFQNEHGA